MTKKPLNRSLVGAKLAKEDEFYTQLSDIERELKHYKQHFKGKGFESKLSTIASELPDFEWQKGARPYQTIKDLSRFRHIVVHAKVHTSAYEADATTEPFHIRWDHPWDDFFTEEAVRRAREDILVFSQSLVEAMREVSDHPHVQFDAYNGSLASASS